MILVLYIKTPKLISSLVTESMLIFIDKKKHERNNFTKDHVIFYNTCIYVKLKIWKKITLAMNL